mmetsp:Transcript_55637/g.162660  ORF Transcript_55637/g.162660 Transcript_55637/m.162660 type:complete len:202 (-) Transcript_55637:67-672(-)
MWCMCLGVGLISTLTRIICGQCALQLAFSTKQLHRWRDSAMLMATTLLSAGASSETSHGWIGARVLDRPDPEECEMRTMTGDSLYVEYEIFIDDTSQGKSKLEFKLGAAPVVGWNDHLADMCIDEQRELTIPPSTHRHQNIGMSENVSKDSVLQFQIRLLDINGVTRKASYARWKARDERAKQRSAQGQARSTARKTAVEL